MCQSVKRFFFLHLMKICWLAPGRVLASCEENVFCQYHLTILYLFEGKFEILEFCLVVRIRLVDIHTGKCIRRFGGIYAYCRYFIDRKW